MTSLDPEMTQPQSGQVTVDSHLISTREQRRPNLPHLGTYVIDTPRDTHWSWRQRCLQFHETHRGVLRKVNVKDPLPEIPKRYDLRTVQDGPEQDVSTANITLTPNLNIPVVSRTEKRDKDKGENVDQSESGQVNKVASRSIYCVRTFTKQSDRMSDRLIHSSVTLRSSDNRPRNRQVTTSFPCYDILCTPMEIQPNISTRTKPPRSEPSIHLSTTSVNRKFLLPNETSTKTGASQGGKSAFGPNIGHVINEGNAHDTVPKSVRDVRPRPLSPALRPVKHVGHTSRHKEWSNLRLAEVLKHRAVPVLDDQILASVTRGRHKRTPHSVDRVDSEDEHKVRGEESWLQMVNSPLVDKDIYDRYANVKLCL